MNASEQSNVHATPPLPSIPGGACLDPEQDLLGQFLRDPVRTFLACKQARLTSAEFFYPEHRIIFGACYSLQEKGRAGGMDEVEDELRRNGDLDRIGSAGVGGPEILRSLMRRVHGDTESASELARTITDMAVGRRSYEILSNARRSIELGGGNNVAHLREVIETLNGVASRRSGPTTIRRMDGGMFASTRERMVTESQTGSLNPLIVPTGFQELDLKFGGFLRRGRTTVVLGASDLGKTTFSIELHINVGTSEAEPRHKSAILYLEGQQEDLVQRMIELKANMSFAAQGKLESWRQAKDVLEAGRFYCDAGGRRFVEELGRFAGFLRDEGVSLLIVDSSECLDVGDYKGGMGVSAENLAWTYKLQVLKDIAQNYNMAVLLNAVIDDAATPAEARRVLSGTEGLTDMAALLTHRPPTDGGEPATARTRQETLNLRRLHIFHNHNGEQGSVDFTVSPERAGVMLPMR